MTNATRYLDARQALDVARRTVHRIEGLVLAGEAAGEWDTVLRQWRSSVLEWERIVAENAARLTAEERLKLGVEAGA